LRKDLFQILSQVIPDFVVESLEVPPKVSHVVYS
jgi:hypothetical protein